MNTKKIIYSVIKEVQKGNEPKASDFGLTQKEFADVAKIIKDEGYLDNVAIASTIVWLNNSKVTMKGLEYLESNNVLAKTYNGLKEIRDWLK